MRKIIGGLIIVTLLTSPFVLMIDLITHYEVIKPQLTCVQQELMQDHFDLQYIYSKLNTIHEKLLLLIDTLSVVAEKGENVLALAKESVC